MQNDDDDDVEWLREGLFDSQSYPEVSSDDKGQKAAHNYRYHNYTKVTTERHPCGLFCNCGSSTSAVKKDSELVGLPRISEPLPII